MFNQWLSPFGTDAENVGHTGTRLKHARWDDLVLEEIRKVVSKTV